MTENSLRDIVFPFVCDNSDCKKKYYKKDFFSVADERGFIWLTSEKSILVGLTCSACNKTTIRNYKPKSFNLNDPEANRFKHVVKFTPGNLDLLCDTEGSEAFQLPECFRAGAAGVGAEFQHRSILPAYPEWFEKKCVSKIFEKDLSLIISNENENQKKVLPRIISDRSTHLFLDEMFLTSLYSDDMSADDLEYSYDEADPILHELASLARDYFNSPTNLTKDDLRNSPLQFRYYPGYESGLEKLVPNLLQEYAQKRATFGFERTYKIDMLDKYFKVAFIREGYFGSEQYFSDKLKYQVKYNGRHRRIKPKQYDEIMTSEQVAMKLGVDPIFLKGLILKGDLSAYQASDFRYVYIPQGHGVKEIADTEPQKFIYLRSEVDAIFVRQLSLAEQNQMVPPDINDQYIELDQDAPGGQQLTDVVEYARLLHEESEWRNSINVAVQVGLSCCEGKKYADLDELIDFINQLGGTIPISAIGAMWDAIPAESKGQKDLVETEKYKDWKNREYAIYSRGELTGKEKRDLGSKRKKIEQRNKSIIAAMKISDFLIKNGEKIKRPELVSKIYELESEIISASIDKIIVAISAEPKLAKFRSGPGNPNKTRINDAHEGDI